SSPAGTRTGSTSGGCGSGPTRSTCAPSSPSRSPRSSGPTSGVCRPDGRPGLYHQSRGGLTMATLEGTVSISGLPPHRGLILNLCFYSVPAADAPAPYGGDPPATAATDCPAVYKQVDLNAETDRSTYELPFSIERPPGHYYLQVRAILFRMHGEKVFAQVEAFFYSRRPVEIPQTIEGRLTLPVAWPTQSVDELHH